MLTKEQLQSVVTKFVAEYPAPIPGLWRTPLVGYADVHHPGFVELRRLVHPQHDLPLEVLPDATVVLSYFVPYSAALSEGNRATGLSSADWAQAYEVTNTMLGTLAQHLIATVEEAGLRAALSPQATVFDRDNVTSRWSQRHIAYLAGLGTFGLNNMLITEAGCSGRLGSLVTSLDIEPGSPLREDFCLYKKSGQCKACLRLCPSGALTAQGFDRHKCFDQCLKNAAVHTTFGSSYAATPGSAPVDSGSEVCGKCLVGLPCTLKRP